ncbi:MULTISPECIES: lipopolysaccharide assembly protein LapA domain-containing protein [Xanthobacter]|uniref:lipopolysaccharide assembly protein LapA domain-containing protein n=1 Tax=Xanthobacter TaxID=279 RepID=UPI002023029F|nr:lipopolysaccharide assembly protein LapA domain-containing protein [Xanthobacter aminoxidans]
MSRFLSILIGLPLAILAIALAVANRKPVVLSLDPFAPDHPALSVTLPLFAIIFAAVIVGVIAGGVVTWARQGRYRREARAARREHKRAEAARPAPSSQLGLPAPRH